jgi:hypothetical protein
MVRLKTSTEIHVEDSSVSVPGGYKYGNLALTVEGVSNETVKYGCRYWATRTIE